MSAMASLAGDTAPVDDTAVESVAPSRLCDSNGHKGMHPMHTHIMPQIHSTGTGRCSDSRYSDSRCSDKVGPN